MKNQLRNFCLSAIIILLSISVNAQNIKFSGQVFYKNNTLKDVKIELIDQDKKVVEELTKRNGKFKIKLEEDKIYFMKVTKEKFVSKVIMISSFMKEEAKEKFEFDIELHKEREFRYVDAKLENKTVAHIFYNNKKLKFDWDRSLTQESKEEIAMLKELNKEKRNEKYSKF